MVDAHHLQTFAESSGHGNPLASQPDPHDVYGLCFMCSVRCPIKVTVQNGDVVWLEGNPHVAGIEGSLCVRGAAGISLLHDPERLQHPLIRTGDRGSGRFRRAGWDEALDYVAGKLKDVIDKYGPRSIVMGERTNLNTHLSKTLLKALGSPNHFTHDALCKGSVNSACRSMFGYTDGQMGFDYKNTKHITFFGRNFFEAIEVKGVNQLMTAIDSGAKITYIDPRVTKTAVKADRYWMIRPGTDLALIYGLIHIILEEKLYDEKYVQTWVKGFDELKQFITPYTPEWAENETGIPAREMFEHAREVSAISPRCIYHFGYRGAHHTNEIYLRRGILILNSLMGSIEAKGGLFFKKGAGDAGKAGPRKLTDQSFPKMEAVRFDRLGTKENPIPDPAHGMPQLLPLAILNEDPYPIKALIVNRIEPLFSIPDTQFTRKALDKLDLLVTIDINPSDIAWYSDVILPESTYLERTDSFQIASGLKPQLFLRKQAVKPRYDTKSGIMILKGLAERMGIGEFFPYTTEEELLEYMLEGTGITIKDFEAKGFVALSDKEILWDRENGIKLKTPSKKIEFISSLLEDNGFASFPAYEPLQRPPEGKYRLTMGRCAFHTHISTQNNPYLNEIISENVLWINSREAAALGIQSGGMVEVSSSLGSQRIKAYVTDMIHPECVFMLHGFGHEVPVATRSYKKGANDSILVENVSDLVGGSPALHHTLVTVNPV